MYDTFLPTNYINSFAELGASAYLCTSAATGLISQPKPAGICLQRKKNEINWHGRLVCMDDLCVRACMCMVMVVGLSFILVFDTIDGDVNTLFMCKPKPEIN